MVQETLSCGYLAVMARGGVPGGRNRAGTSLTVYFVNSVARSLLWAKYLLAFRVQGKSSNARLTRDTDALSPHYR